MKDLTVVRDGIKYLIVDKYRYGDNDKFILINDEDGTFTTIFCGDITCFKLCDE